MFLPDSAEPGISIAPVSNLVMLDGNVVLQYAEALQVAKIIPHKLELERAYCFYRTKNV